MSVFTVQDLKGKLIGGTTLRVSQRESGSPVRWRCVCVVCGSSQVHPHSHLTSSVPVARCANKACGKTPASGKPTETAHERNAREWREYEEGRVLKTQQAEARKKQEQLDRRNRELAAEKKQQRRGELILAQRAREQEFDSFGLNDDEVRSVMEQLGPEDFYDLGATKVHALSAAIAAKRGVDESR